MPQSSSNGLLRLEMQAAMFDIVDTEWKLRAGRTPANVAATKDVAGVGAAFASHVAALATPDLFALRLQLARSLLHETDLRIATGEAVATNEEMIR